MDTSPPVVVVANSEKLQRRRRVHIVQDNSSNASSPVIDADSERTLRISRSLKMDNGGVSGQNVDRSSTKRHKVVYDEDQQYLKPSQSATTM